jgi:hypothetical protein
MFALPNLSISNCNLTHNLLHPQWQIHKLITQILDIAVKLSSYVRTHESRLSGNTHVDAKHARGLWKEHNATLQALVDKLQRIGSDREHFVREFAQVH